MTSSAALHFGSSPAPEKVTMLCLVPRKRMTLLQNVQSMQYMPKKKVVLIEFLELIRISSAGLKHPRPVDELEYISKRLIKLL